MALFSKPARKDRSPSPSGTDKDGAPDAQALARGHPALEAAVARSRKLLHRRAMMAAAAGVVPVPGLDWAVDAALLTRLIPQINAEFGLTPAQLDRLTPHKREQVQKAVGMVGSALIGRLITRELVMRALRIVGVRLTAQQAAKFVPLAGQAASAALGYATLRYLGEMHLRDCVEVAKTSDLLLPAPAPTPTPRRGEA